MEMDQCSKGKLVVPQHFSLAHGPSSEKLEKSIGYCTEATLSARSPLIRCCPFVHVDNVSGLMAGPSLKTTLLPKTWRKYEAKFLILVT